MTPIGIAVFIVLIATLAYLYTRLIAQRRLLSRLQQELTALASAWNFEHADLSEFIESKPSPVITIEILNAVELAAKNSNLGQLIGKYAPDMIRKKVVKHTADNLRDHMTQNGVQVDVNIHGIR